MPKRKWNLNTIYISERLQECFRPISRYALTTVVAPMGYGKTTAVNRYLSERMKAEDVSVIRINIYSDNLTIFWKSVQEAFSRAGLDFLHDYACPTDRAGAGLLADDLCHALAGQKRYYIFIDDLHLLTDNRVVEFICILTGRLPENVHLIAAAQAASDRARQRDMMYVHYLNVETELGTIAGNSGKIAEAAELCSTKYY